MIGPIATFNARTTDERGMGSRGDDLTIEWCDGAYLRLGIHVDGDIVGISMPAASARALAGSILSTLDGAKR